MRIWPATAFNAEEWLDSGRTHSFYCSLLKLLKFNENGPYNADCMKHKLFDTSGLCVAAKVIRN